MDNNLTFLTVEQIFGDEKLDILKKYGTACAITDFSILLGGDVNDDYHTKEGKTDKDRTGWWWTRTDFGDNDARFVDYYGDSYGKYVYDRDGGARPALPYSSISSIASNEVIGSFGIKEVECGEYPQTIVDERFSRELEENYKRGSGIRKTGKTYTTDSVYFDDYDKSFKPRKHEEFEYKGRRYIRIVGDHNSENYKLSDGRTIVSGEPYWVAVEPIKWLVDERANIALSKKIIFSGVQFKKTRDYKGDFNRTDIKQFIDKHFSKDIKTTATLSYSATESKEESSKIVEERRLKVGFLMTREQIKQELIDRYKYIYENAVYIFAPYMYQETKEDRDKLNKEYRKEDKNHPFISNDLLIYLKELPSDLLLDLESFLLSDTPFNQSKLFIELEQRKKESDFLNRVKTGLSLLEKDNSKHSSIQIKLDSWNLLVRIREFINEQSGDLKNKEKKLIALDEYFRINRYKNDGKIWTSGFSTNFRDMDNFSSFGAVLLKNERKPRRNREDIGVKKGDFINFIADKSNHYDYNFSILTEQEKQDIYLTYHDELPYNLEIVCEMEEECIPQMIEARLVRPEHTRPCGETFYVSENEIFINPEESFYRYYQLCPHCGFIVNIPKDALSDGIKKRIEERCSKDPNLFRKMYLYSELFSLDKSSSIEQKILLKTK